MRLEYQSAEKLQKMILGVIAKHLDIREYKVFLFGSRVSGKSHERSDIDVGIKGLCAVPFATMSKIEDDIEELPTLYRIEVVDFARVAPKFKAIAERQVEYLTQ